MRSKFDLFYLLTWNVHPVKALKLPETVVLKLPVGELKETWVIGHDVPMRPFGVFEATLQSEAKADDRYI